MRQTRTRRLEYDVELSSFCSPATILAVLLILAVSSRFSGTGAAAEEEKPPSLDQASLRYLPDGCRILGRIDVDALLKCKLGQNVAKSIRNDAHFARLGLELEQIERIVIGAQAFGPDEASQYVYVLSCKQPIVQPKWITTWVEEEVAQRTVWTKPGKETGAVCAAEDRIVLIGVPETIRTVLRRNGPAEIPQELVQAYGRLSDDAGAAMAVLPTVELVSANPIGIPIARELAERVDALNVEIDFGTDLALRAAAICRDEAAAQQLNGIGLGIWGLLKSHGVEQQEPSVQQMLKSVECRVDGSVLTASMDVPSGMIQMTNSVTPNTVAPVKRLAVPAYPPIPAPFAPAAAAYSSGAVIPPPKPTASGPSPYAAPVASPPPAFNPYPPGTVPPTGPTPPPSYTPTPNWDPYASPGYRVPAPPRYPPYVAGWSRVNPVLPISDVIRMSEVGVDEEVMIRHIQKHRLHAALTADDLILLTENEVSTEVITALQDLPSAPPPSPVEPKPAHAAETPRAIR